jgi:hypothetical protein
MPARGGTIDPSVIAQAKTDICERSHIRSAGAMPARCLFAAHRPTSLLSRKAGAPTEKWLVQSDQAIRQIDGSQRPTWKALLQLAWQLV